MTNLQTKKQRIISFFWQHFLLLLSLNLMTLGVALCVRSNLGSSVISSLPYVLSLAGPVSFIPEWTIGNYTIFMNFVFVICQMIILRKEFEFVQLFQLVIGFVFGWLIDFNMWLTDFLVCETLPVQAVTQLLGCTVMGILGCAAIAPATNKRESPGRNGVTTKPVSQKMITNRMA